MVLRNGMRFKLNGLGDNYYGAPSLRQMIGQLGTVVKSDVNGTYYIYWDNKQYFGINLEQEGIEISVLPDIRPGMIARLFGLRAVDKRYDLMGNVFSVDGIGTVHVLWYKDLIAGKGMDDYYGIVPEEDDFNLYIPVSNENIEIGLGMRVKLTNFNFVGGRYGMEGTVIKICENEMVYVKWDNGGCFGLSDKCCEVIGIPVIYKSNDLELGYAKSLKK